MNNMVTETRLQKIRTWLFGPPSRFNVGDSVQLLEGGDLMVVIQVHSTRGMKRPLVECKWQESSTRDVRTQLFPEDRLKLFDWYNA